MTNTKEIYKEICFVFARLGLFAFGGPAAHIAMMEDELVTKRNWLSKSDFMDLLGFTNLIPGPNSTELAIALGYKRGGKIGLFLAGICFILPAMTIVLLLAFLQAEFIDRYAALTSTQLLEAVAIGQFTPGPVFTTATFVGYLIQGVPGAILATVGIFLPSFLLILLLHPLFNRLRSSEILSVILDGITIASLALMASVSWQLGMATFVSWVSVVIFAASFIGLTRFKVNSSYLIIMGGFIGWLVTMF